MKILQEFLQEATKKTFDLWAAQKAAQNRAIKKEIADRERAEREAIKKHNREIAAMDRASAKKAATKLQQSEIWNKVQTVIGNSFPDGDPIDHLIPWMKKTGVTMDQIDAAARKIQKAKGMYVYLAQMWDDMQGSAVFDANNAIKNNERVNDNSVFFYFDGEKIVKNQNPWKP